MASTTQLPEIIEFETQLGKDELIRVPEGLEVPPGLYRVTISSLAPKTPMEPTNKRPFEYMIEIAEEARRLNPDLPCDMAENHDHYAHGAPKK